jgi:hypothetical protein
MPRARKVDYNAVALYAQQHPEAVQTEIGRVFGITQGLVGRILRRLDLTNTHRGKPRKVDPPKGTWAEVAYFYWDRHLQELGFGMRRGDRLGGKELLYGDGPALQLQQALQADSAALPEEEDEQSIFEVLTREHSIECCLPTSSESADAGEPCL